MQYLGGKFRIAKPLGGYLESRREGRYVVEPFCGALNVTVQFECERLASDASPYLFSLYRALREGWQPPESVSEETWRELKAKKDPDDPMTAFAGYGCSFSGMFFGTYARGGEERNYAQNARNTLLKKMAKCRLVTFAHYSYERLTPGKALVYCDPPYAGTAGYSAVGEFDSAAFWERVREWAREGATVLVSEYAAPEDFRCVWSMATRTDMHGAGRAGRIEKLFEWAGQ